MAATRASLCDSGRVLACIGLSAYSWPKNHASILLLLPHTVVLPRCWVDWRGVAQRSQLSGDGQGGVRAAGGQATHACPRGPKVRAKNRDPPADCFPVCFRWNRAAGQCCTGSLRVVLGLPPPTPAAPPCHRCSCSYCPGVTDVSVAALLTLPRLRYAGIRVHVREQSARISYPAVAALSRQCVRRGATLDVAGNRAPLPDDAGLMQLAVEALHLPDVYRDHGMESL